MSESIRVTVRFGEEEDLENLEDIEEIADEEDSNTSEVVRNAIGEFLHIRSAPPYVNRKRIDFAKGQVERVDQLIEEGYAIDRGDLVRAAVNDYLDEYK